MALHDPVPDARTIWFYREQPAQARGRANIARFDSKMRTAGCWQWGTLSIRRWIEARRPRLIEQQTYRTAVHWDGHRHSGAGPSARGRCKTFLLWCPGGLHAPSWLLQGRSVQVNVRTGDEGWRRAKAGGLAAAGGEAM